MLTLKGTGTVNRTTSRREFVKGTTAGLFAVVAGVGSSPGLAARGKPNIVFILSDDQGWNGLSVEMHPDIPGSKSDYYRTPNIERLAREGLRFSDAYCPAPMCSPTRASLLTGMTPAQSRMTNVGGGARAAARSPRPTPSYQKLKEGPNSSVLPMETTTIGEVLSKAGYATAYFGKWHLGTDGPEQHGFDVSDGPTGNTDGAAEDPNPKDIFGMTRRGSAFMQKNVKEGKPFYLQLWHYAVHGPLQSLKTTERDAAARPKGEVHSDATFAAMTEDLDTGVGMTLKKIDELGIADNTYVIYMSDNGPGPRYSPATPLTAGKGTLWEGGIRVPLIVRGPGVKAGGFCHERVAGWDMFPTFCDLAGVESPLPDHLAGGSIVSLLASGNGKVERMRQELVFHYPHYGQRGGRKVPQSAIYLGDYKLMKFYETNELKLFNIRQDVAEQNDLAKAMPEKVEMMHRRMEKYLKDVDAGMPEPNPDYDPEAALVGRRGRRRTGAGRTGERSGRTGGRRGRRGPRVREGAARRGRARPLEGS